MPADAENVDTRPQPRKPLIAGTGWLLFVCAFLPTLRVCSDPVSPYEFPPVYVVYLGAAVLGWIAVTRAVRARRAWLTVWFVLWFATAVTWAGAFAADASPVVALLLISVGIVGCVLAAIAFHRQKHTARGMWIAGIVHGALSTMWYVLLATDNGAVWGAYVGLAASIAFLFASGVTLSQHAAELERRRRETAPAPLPTARLVER